MAKGSEFERSICKQLSLWWTHNCRDDIFWRSTTSGARATVRARQGKRTTGNYGDITATDPIGHKLIDCLCFELKRGYSRCSLHDALDYGATQAEQEWVKHVQQAIQAWHHSGSYSWALISRRDRRRPMIFVPYGFYKELKSQGAFKSFFEGGVIAFQDRNHTPHTLFCCGWDVFLSEVNPAMIKEIVK